MHVRRVSCAIVLASAAIADAEINCTKAFTSLITAGCICTPCHLCSFSLVRGCQVIAPNAVTLSDGSDVQPRQPSLDPTDWFLSADEITRARDGVPRNDLQPHTLHNSVTVLPFTNEYFHALYDDLIQTRSGDAIFVTAWMVRNVPYIPDIDPKQTVEQVWTKLIGNDVALHALIFENTLKAKALAPMYHWLNGLNRLHAQMVLDNRAPVMGSLHQKATVIQRKQAAAVAYLGGVDHDVDRWDTKYHNNSGLRHATGVQKDYNGWVDVHTRIQGAATQDILNTFLQRWNDPSPPTISTVFGLQASTNESNSNVPRPLAPLDLGPQPSTGSHAVQIVRTYSCRYDGYNAFAPSGETTVLAGHLKAIRQAKNVIYIEDQYFIYMPDLLDALLKALLSIQRLVVVTGPRGADSANAGYDVFLYDMAAPLQDKFPNKVQIYKTPADIYVHSKVLLVDDVFLSVGSSNWNVRSMTSDAEMAANIVDTASGLMTPDHIAVAALAHNFRLTKFGEFTRFSIDFSNLTLVEGADALAKYASQPTAFVRPFVAEYKQAFDLYEGLRGVVDGDGRCKPKQSSTMVAMAAKQLRANAALVLIAMFAVGSTAIAVVFRGRRTTQLRRAVDDSPPLLKAPAPSHRRDHRVGDGRYGATMHTVNLGI
ncbi:Aste57867_21062 [Aphanomyces stellatus]|uniref:phospholipase D n=1 Tax=Aphanomyces stellatus TaxID=120398 RepID=A0A485LGN5_9STRA|nr:hypothetical protein As57867_020994 [Aphanomyces stellatus]VFT97737.1 Aste57867_21062 [Aphanomyces stellatus]